LTLIEAKLNSRLSAGTKNAPEYDQAARYVACMAQVLSLKPRRPEQMVTLDFLVTAPASQIGRGLFNKQLTKHSIAMKVSRRIAQYEDTAQNEWLDYWFTPTLERARIAVLSWEEIGEFIDEHDAGAGKSFFSFYNCCLKYNRLEFC
jgi:hypothetical protein